MTLKQLVEIINKNEQWSYSDFEAVLPEIRQLAEDGVEDACRLEDEATVINGDTAFDATKQKLTKLLRSITNNSRPVDTVEGLIKESYRLLIDGAGYISLSGILPKNVYSQLFINRSRLADHEDNQFAKFLHKQITIMLSAKDTYVVSEVNPDFKHEHDYMMFIAKGKYPSSMIKKSKRTGEE